MFTSSANYIATCATVVALALIVAVTFLKNRAFRSTERLAALKDGENAKLFFSGRLLSYIPWQFWTSLGLLALILISALVFRKVSPDDSNMLLELAKYVTGAVVGSLFGKQEPGKADEDSQAAE